MNTVNDRMELREVFFDMAHSPFIIFDEGLCFAEANEMTLDALQTNATTLIGKHLTELFPGVEHTNRYQTYLNVIKTGEAASIENVELTFGSKLYIFNIKAFRVGKGLGLSLLDNTKLVHTINQLEDTKRHLEKVNLKLKDRNKELQELSFVASHDLKAPVANLISLCSFIEEECGGKKEVPQLFSKMKLVIDLMNKKINAMNDIVVLKTNLKASKSILYFEDILEEIKSENSEEIQNTKTEIYADFSACPQVLYNNIQLHSVMTNLVTNAIRFAHPDRAPFIQIKTSTKNGRTLLSIEDNGLGFNDAVDRNKIFGLFKKMHSHTEGLGVGLYIVDSIIHSQGGSIEVKSKKNTGTIFKLFLS